jgi:tight adherence protein B
VFIAAVLCAYIVLSTLSLRAEEKAGEGGVASSGDAAMLARFITPIKLARLRLNVGFGFFLFLFLVLTAAGISFVGTSLVALVFGVFGSYLPLVWFRRKVAQRKSLFNSQILELTTGLANGMRAGQAFPAALESVSGRIQWPMKEELSTVLREYRLGSDLPEALDRLNQRIPSEDLTLLIGSIRLTTQAGGSLAEVLDRMVEMIRGRREFQDKLESMTAQGRFEAIAMSLAPLFVFILLFLIDRPLMLPLVTTIPGWITIAADATLVTIGFLVIRKIVTIEV